MNLFTEASGFRRAMIVAGAAGLGLAVIAFVPSPLRLFDLFTAHPAPEVKAPPPLRLAPVPDIKTFDVVAERPLFNAGRKPDPPPPPPEAPKAAVTLGDLAQYRLLGVMADAQVQRAIVQKSGGASTIMKPGDTFEGWTIDKIDATGVALSGGDRKETLTIPKAKNGAPAP